jgi:hypothetical protein
MVQYPQPEHAARRAEAQTEAQTPTLKPHGVSIRSRQCPLLPTLAFKRFQATPSRPAPRLAKLKGSAMEVLLQSTARTVCTDDLPCAEANSTPSSTSLR